MTHGLQLFDPAGSGDRAEVVDLRKSLVDQTDERLLDSEASLDEGVMDRPRRGSARRRFFSRDPRNRRAGILIMNAVSYGLPDAAYFNLSDAGSDTRLDRVIGAIGEILAEGSTRSDAIGLACYRSLVCWGLGIGLPIAAAGVAVQPIADFSPDIAILGEAPNTRCATYWTMQPIRENPSPAAAEVDGLVAAWRSGAALRQSFVRLSGVNVDVIEI